MAVSGIDHVQIAAPPGCETAARAFYGDLLGMHELPKPDALRRRGGVWFRDWTSYWPLYARLKLLVASALVSMPHAGVVGSPTVYHRRAKGDP